jgi:D-alanyl-lipoteichoic acid acyltransferase DltB (MBOAT superfamily)
LILLGYFFRCVVADSCALIADPIFANPGSENTIEIYAAALSFCAQLYMDLLGYTQIARGCSLLFNIELPINFDHPFNRTNMAEGLGNWQMTLTRWIYDYLYRPLGGSRKSLPATMRNVFLTYLVMGVWHGAGWNFVLFGIFIGAASAGYHAYRRLRKALLKDRDRFVTGNIWYHRAAHVITIATCVLAIVYFRSPDIHTALIFTEKLSDVPSLFKDVVGSFLVGNLRPLGSCAASLIILLGGRSLVSLYEQLFKPMPYWAKAQVASAAVILSWIMGGSAVKPFIYFQF